MYDSVSPIIQGVKTGYSQCPSGKIPITLTGLIQVDQGSQHRYFTYDGLSRLQTAKNPEQVDGSLQQVATSYTYDNASNLLTKTTPVTGPE